jgi:hypothetical protein
MNKMLNYTNNISTIQEQLNPELIQPFGPTILHAVCPKKYIDSINKFVEVVTLDDKQIGNYSSRGGKIPNLLFRDIENIYLDKKYSQELEITSFLETIGNKYLELNQIENFSCFVPDIDYDLDMSFKKFKDSNSKVNHISAWINRYFSGDFTPVHTHESDLSGIIILDISKELLDEQIKDIDGDTLSTYTIGNKRTNGSLQFLYNSSHVFDCGSFTPEQNVGDIYVFPSWLSHVVYPQKNNKERRTLSFNLNIVSK